VAAGPGATNGALIPSGFVRAAVERALPGDIRLVEVQVDPRSAQVLLEILLPAGGVTLTDGEQSAEAVRERVLRAALQAARAAVDAEPRLQRASVRVLLDSAPATPPAPAGTLGAAAAPALAFVGDIEASALRDARLDPAAATATRPQVPFSSPWWAPFLDPGDPAPRP
jgi:hypothetical protein